MTQRKLKNVIARRGASRPRAKCLYAYGFNRNCFLIENALITYKTPHFSHQTFLAQPEKTHPTPIPSENWREAPADANTIGDW
jgi:hypothetical protein